MIKMVLKLIIKIFGQMISHIFRRGRGVFKLLFVIDDFIRLFTMTILIPIFFSWLGFGSTLRIAGTILGLVIDVHDFITEFGKAKEDLNVFKK